MPTSNTAYPTNLDNLVEGPTGSLRDNPSNASLLNAVQNTIGTVNAYNFVYNVFFPFTFNSPYTAANLANGTNLISSVTGQPVKLPVNTIIEDFGIRLLTPFDGWTPQFDLGVGFNSATPNTTGLVGQLLAPTVGQTIPLDGVPNAAISNPGYLISAPAMSYQTIAAGVGFTKGPPYTSTDIYVNATGAALNLGIWATQDGTCLPAGSPTLTAASSISSLVVGAGNTNGVFSYQGADPVIGGGFANGGTPIVFHIPVGTWTGHTGASSIEAGLSSAVSQADGSLFSQWVTVSNTGGGSPLLVLSDNGYNPATGTANTGFTGNGNSVINGSGTHDALAPLGFTGNLVFGGGQGGNPGSSQGSAVLYMRLAVAVAG